MDTAAEITRCSQDVAYFVSEYCQIKDDDGQWVDFTLWDDQVKALRVFTSSKQAIALKARQVGITWLVLAYALHVLIFQPGVTVLLFSLREKEAIEILERLMNMYWRLPAFLQWEGTKEGNKTSFELANDSRALAFPTGTGDSYTAKLAIIDEADVLANDLKKTINSVKPTIDAGGQLFLVSKSNKAAVDSPFKKIYRAAKNGDNNWGYVFLPWSSRPGRTQQWYDEQRRNDLATNGSLDYTMENYPGNDTEALAPSSSDKRFPHQWLHACFRHEQPEEPPPQLTHIVGLKVYKEPILYRDYVMGCLPDGELVETADGLQAIDSVQAGDKVIDADGESVRVVNVYRRKYEGEIVKVTPCYSLLSTKFTPEHPIMVLADTKQYRNNAKQQRKRKVDVAWKEAGSLSIGDILRIPLPKIEKLSRQEMTSKISDQLSVRIDRWINPDVIFEQDFWFLVGLWLAEGWVTRVNGRPSARVISFSLNAKTEMRLAKKIASIIKRLFNRTASISDRSRQARRGNVVEITFGCEPLARFLEENFGCKADGKFVSNWVKRLPNDLLIQLCNGYLTGDGCVAKERGYRVIEAVSVSKRMLVDFQDIFLSLGLVSSLSILRSGGCGEISGRKFIQKETYHLRLAGRECAKLLTMFGRKTQFDFSRRRCMQYGWIEDGYLYLKVRKIEREEYSGFVNNFETETHTYCSRYITVHNCDPAEGNPNSHDSSFVLIDKLCNEEIACFSAKVSPAQLAKYCHLVAKVYNKAEVMPERNNHGHAFIEWWEENGKGINLLKGHDDKIGWVSNRKSKTILADYAAELFRDRMTIIHTQKALDQLMLLDGIKIEVAEENNEHGDLAIAYLLALMASQVSTKTCAKSSYTPDWNLASAGTPVFGVRPQRQMPFGAKMT